MGKFEAKKPKKRAGTFWWISAILLLLAAACAAWRYTRPAGSTPSVPEERTVQPQPEIPAPAASAAPPSRQLEAQIVPPPQSDADDAPAENAAPEPPSQPQSNTLTLMALGDNLIHWSVYRSAQTESGYDFMPFYEDIAKITAQYDLSCINQETIFINDRQQLSTFPMFGTPPEVGDALAAAGFDIVTCATNHAYDKQETGIYDTICFWREKYPQITMLGLHDSPEDAETVRVIEKNGIRLALLNYTYSLNGFVASQPWLVDMLDDREKIAADLAWAEQNADFSLVFVHWGVEYQFSPVPAQTEAAQFLADSGADLIIGAHPHAIEPVWETTSADGRQVPVFYSLGNFLSQQPAMVNHLGAMASVEITKDETGAYVSHYEALPTVNMIFSDPDGPLYSYRPMLLRDCTQDMADRHVLGCSLQWLQQKFDAVMALTDPNAPATEN